MSDEKRGKTRKKDHLQSETYLGNKVWRTAGSLENVCVCVQLSNGKGLLCRAS